MATCLEKICSFGLLLLEKICLFGLLLLNKSFVNVCQFAGWLTFGFSGPLGQYFSLNRAILQREGKRERTEESKMSKTPHPHLLQEQYALAVLSSKL